MPDHQHTNRLIHESSPYLLQHAHNPVDWHSWNEDTLEKAVQLDKMLLISIGYAACHWCHVMEKESFMDEQVARIMNENFICIKVDREERPDVDQVYMQAVQMVTGSGGWPLNCFALPNGQPFFGGTYFRKQQWMNLLENISLLYQTRRNDMKEQANQIREGMEYHNSLLEIADEGDYSHDDIQRIYEKIAPSFDLSEGGMKGAPKFPLPVNHEFILDYHFHTKEKESLDFVKLSLRKMAFGGIFDQLGGGFARYSTDANWKVPHFEKMLYDNAQLVSLYSHACQCRKNSLLKETIEQSLEFIRKEMSGDRGEFYSSLDADSEGEEGRYYVWQEGEFKLLLGPNADMIGRFYGVGSAGRWEGSKNILLRSNTYDEFAKDHKMSPSAFRQLLNSSRQKLIRARSKRARPALDDKTLTSWNALMAIGYIDAYKALQKKDYLESARENINFLLENVTGKGNRLLHSWKDGKAFVNGFLEDYAFTISALLKLHEVSLEEEWLKSANAYTDLTIKHFLDEDSGLFHFNSDEDPPLVARQKETHDSVIPSSNSVMAENLFILGQVYENEKYISLAGKMLHNMKSRILQNPSGYLNWARVAAKMAYPFYIVAISGKDAIDKAIAMHSHYMPNVYITGSAEKSDMPYLQGRYKEDETMIYVCTGRECKLPTADVKEALKMLQ